MGALAPGDQGGQVQVPEACSGLPGANTARFSTLELENEDGGRDKEQPAHF